LYFVEEVEGLFLLPSFLHLNSSQQGSWLSFHHGAFIQDRPQHQEESEDRTRAQSALRKMMEISDLFRFITEFVFEEFPNEEEEEEEMSDEENESDDSSFDDDYG
jgi:2-phosphoglycerate kinase